MAQENDQENLERKMRSLGDRLREFHSRLPTIPLTSLERFRPRFSFDKLWVAIGLAPIMWVDWHLAHGVKNSCRNAGVFALLPASVNFFCEFVQTFRSLAIRLDADALRRVAFESTDGRVPEFIGRADLTEPVISGIGSTLAEDIASGLPGGRFLHESLVRSMAARLIRNHASLPITPLRIERGLSPIKLRSAVDNIESHLFGESSLFKIAEASGPSPYHQLGFETEKQDNKYLYKIRFNRI